MVLSALIVIMMSGWPYSDWGRPQPRRPLKSKGKYLTKNDKSSTGSPRRDHDYNCCNDSSADDPTMTPESIWHHPDQTLKSLTFKTSNHRQRGNSRKRRSKIMKKRREKKNTAKWTKHRNRMSIVIIIIIIIIIKWVQIRDKRMDNHARI